MLAGVGPLLGEDVCGYFMDRDGGNPDSWAYRDGTSYQGYFAEATVTGPAYILKAKGVRIAVLTGPQTASSGEVTTIAFREKDNARSFGQPTAGYSTTNTNIMMSDNAMLLLTISIYGDRNKNAYGEEVVPDVIVEPKEGEDAALDAAVKWLEKY
jgi:carboxyl-terminal processing protease